MKSWLRKSFCLVVVALLVSAVSVACAPRKPETNLEFWIAQNVDDYDFSEYHCMGGFGVICYYGKDYEITYDEYGNVIEPEYCVSYHVTSYPDYSSNKKHVTQIEITDPEVHVYGLTIHSTLAQFKSTLKSEGYRIKEETWGLVAKKRKFSISLVPGKNISIRAEVTNITGIVF